ncbi:MAG: hypothetical protein ACUVX8_05385 [Candidatus Zipacnadales bacterium]
MAQIETVRMRIPPSVVWTFLSIGVASYLAAALFACAVLADPPPSTVPLRVSVAGVGGAAATLSVSYPTDPGAEQARVDVQQIAEASGWRVSVPERTSIGDVILYEAQITPPVTLDEHGQVPLYPFLHAFRRFPKITFVFVGETGGQPGEFHDENAYIRAQWRRSGRVVTYEFQIKDSSFTGPNDVVLVDHPADQPLPVQCGGTLPPGSRTGYLWVLLIVASLGSGVFVWGLTQWWLSRQAAVWEAAKKGRLA